jgi:hypothetical protein
MSAPELTYDGVLKKGKKLLELSEKSLNTSQELLTGIGYNEYVTEIKELIGNDPDNFEFNIKEYFHDNKQIKKLIFASLTFYAAGYYNNLKLKEEVENLEKSEKSQENLEYFDGRFESYGGSFLMTIEGQKQVNSLLREEASQKYNMIISAFMALLKVNN